MTTKIILAAPFLAAMAFVCQPAMSEDTAVDHATNDAERAVNDAGNELENTADRAAEGLDAAGESADDAARDASDIARDDAAPDDAALDDAQPAAARDDAAAGDDAAAAGEDAVEAAAREGDKDKQFAMKAATMNSFEIAAGQLATEKAKDEQIKQFGQMMVDAHTQANERLAEIAQSKQWQIPSQLRPVQQAMLNELQKLKGKEFDRAYIYGQVAGHVKSALKFRDAKKECQDPELKAYAAETLPKIRQHLQQAQRIAGARDVLTDAGDEGALDGAAQPAAGQDPAGGAGEVQDPASQQQDSPDQAQPDAAGQQ